MALALVVAGVAPACADRKSPVPSVSVGFGVDTAAPDVGEIVRLVRTYLARPDTSAESRALWSRANAIDARSGDLARFYAYQDFPATIVGVISTAPADDVYVVKILHARSDEDGVVTPLAMQRIYAVRAPAARFGWQLSNPLPWLTAKWATHEAGPITFHYAPGQPRDSARAARTVRFVDSVSAMFAIPAPGRLDYYVTASPDEYFRALGLDFYVLPSGRGSATGGNAMTEAGIVLAGDPAQGEAYLHEVAHMVLRDRFGGGAILGEGIPTWLAGSKGRDARALFGILADYQRAHPAVTLASLIDGEIESGWTNAETDALYATGALFVETVFRRGGLPALRRLAGTSSDSAALRRVMAQALGLPTDRDDALERWWRRAAIELQR